MHGLTWPRLLATLGLATVSCGGSGAQGPPGSPPLAIGTFVAVPPVTAVGHRALLVATVHNVADPNALQFSWSLNDPNNAQLDPSSCRVAMFLSANPGTYVVRIEVRDGTQVAAGEVAVVVAATGSAAGEADSDGDGLADVWEIAFFGDPATQDGSGDWDGDGMTNQEEFAAGTDPTVGGR